MNKTILKILYDVLIAVTAILVLVAMYFSLMYPTLFGILLLGYGILVIAILKRHSLGGIR